MHYEPLKTSGKEAGKYWLDLVDRTLRARDEHWNGVNQWRRNVNLFRGKHWKYDKDVQDPDSEAPRQRITVNKTGSIILSMLPFLVRKRPKFILIPTEPEFLVSAKLQGELLNYVWKEHKMNRQIRKAVLDMLVIGHGVVKTGFNITLDEAVKSEKAAGIDYRDYIKSEEPYISRVSPFMFIWDMDSCEKDLHSARWCAEVIAKSARDVIANTNYSESVRKKLKNGEIEATFLETLFNPAAKKDQAPWTEDTADNLWDRPIALIEVWDKRSKKHFVFLHGCNEPLIEEMWPYDYLEDFPYQMLPGIPVIDDMYPIGVPTWIEDQQLELNRIRTFKFEHRRRFNRKYIVDRGGVNPEDLIALKTGGDGTIVLADSTEAVKPIQDAPYPADQDRIEGDIEQDMRELTGADELLQGGKLPSRTTATEIEARTRAIGFKIEDRVEDVDAFVEDIGRQVLQHMKANYTKPQVLRIAGKDGNEWVRFSPGDIKAEVEFEMESISANRYNPDVVRQQALSVFQTVLQSLELLQNTNIKVDVGELFKWLMEKFDDFKDTSRFIQQDAPIGAVMTPSQFLEGISQAGGGGMVGGGPGFTVPQTPSVSNPASPQQAGANTGGGMIAGLKGAMLGG